MFIDTSKLEPDSKRIWYDRAYINTNNILYVKPYIDEPNKTIIVLCEGKEAFIDNDVDEVCRLLNEFERDYKKEKSE
jgi:uncharacterized protein YlzI (FlbEa/FlbD family)